MTIRLLAQYQGNPPNTIVTLAGGVETALVAAGNATTDLSGGVPPVYVTPANSQIGDVLYGPDGVPLGVADRTGKLLMNFSGITVPGAPTGVALTPIAGGVLAAFTPSATLGGTVGTGYEVTLSNGRVQRGAASPIVVNSPAGAVTATVKQINGAGLSVASAASASATVTAYTAPTIPGAPTSLVLTAGNGKVTATWTAAAANGSAIRNTVVTLSNGATATAIGNATTVDVITPNDLPVTATARANNGEGAGPTSAVSNSVTPASVVASAASSMDVLGDSKVAYGEPALTTSGGQTSVSPLGIVNDIERLAGRTGFDVIGFFAVGGTTAQQCLSTQVPQSLASPARTAFVGSGVNSYNDALVGGAGPYTQAQILTAMQSIIDQLSAAKDYVWVRAIDPVNQSGSTGAKARAGEFQAHNAAVAAMCAAKPNVRFVDSYNVLLDPGSGQLNAKADTLRADDGIHNTSLGSRLIGEGIQGPMLSGFTLTPYRPIGPSLLVGFTGNATGGTSTPGSGSITGAANIPAGWNVQVISGAAAVTVSRPDTDTVRLNVVNAGGAASTVYLQYASLSALFAQVTPGTDTIQAGVDFEVLPGAAGLTRVAVSARENGGTPVWNAMARDTTVEPDAVFKYNQAAQSGRRWTHPRTLPGGTTGVEILIAVNAAATVGNFTVDFKNPTYHKRNAA